MKVELNRTEVELAREIMGRNFFGVEAAADCFKIKPSRQQLAALSGVPFSKAVLKQLKGTHVLVAVFPLSILEIRGKVDRGLFYSDDEAWYNKQSFAQERGKIGWQLVRKVPVDDSNLKNWEEQQALIGKDDEVPSAQVVGYSVIGHYVATGDRLFERIWVRTASVDPVGNHVSVGFFVSTGLNIYYRWDDTRYYNLAVSSARKFDL